MYVRFFDRVHCFVVEYEPGTHRLNDANIVTVIWPVSDVNYYGEEFIQPIRVLSIIDSVE